jgi:hypothetical protein
VLEIGGPVIVDVPRLGLPNVTSSSLNTVEQPSLFAHVIPRVPELATITKQKYGIIAPKNRQFEFAKQISQSSRRQAQTFIEEGRRQRRRSTQPIVKQSGGFGSTTSVWLETDRHKTHFSATDANPERLARHRQQQQPQQQQPKSQQQQHTRRSGSSTFVSGTQPVVAQTYRRR